MKLLAYAKNSEQSTLVCRSVGSTTSNSSEGASCGLTTERFFNLMGKFPEFSPYGLLKRG
jgi:hypothetical protein